MPSHRAPPPLLAATTLALLGSCGGVADAPPADPVLAAIVAPLVGAPDRGLDPSVVALTNARGEVCSGVLLAGDVVLTARSCVTRDALLFECPPGDAPAPTTESPSTLHVYTQLPEPAVPWVSSGVAVLTSDDLSMCGADLAVVILGRQIEGVTPVLVSESGIAEGGHVRTVGFGWTSPEGSTMGDLLREHAPVLDVSASEIAVGEATCVAAPGGAAFDETTGEVVGVLSRWGTACGVEGEFDVYTRADAFYGLVRLALAWGPALAVGAGDGGAARSGEKRDAARSRKPPTDVGSACLSPTDCGTGLCVSAQGGEYCSRTCAPADRCPTAFTCVIAASGESVCVRS